MLNGFSLGIENRGLELDGDGCFQTIAPWTAGVSPALTLVKSIRREGKEERTPVSEQTQLRRGHFRARSTASRDVKNAGRRFLLRDLQLEFRAERIDE